MNIHVANLNLNLIESDLQRMFSPFGEVKTVNLIRDSLNNRSRGRAFIDMPVEKEGKKAILNLNGLEIKGKFIVVSEIMYDPGHSTYSFKP
ncbi:MAG: RNA recognition motif domain-containing protein [Flavisolibacter sp.]|jgi:RNA recognition motif-containing protein